MVNDVGRMMAPAWIVGLVLALLLMMVGFVGAVIPGIPGTPLVFLALGAAVILQGLGWIRIELPPWLLAGAYTVVGWTVGLCFTRPIVWYALRLIPLIIAATVVFRRFSRTAIGSATASIDLLSVVSAMPNAPPARAALLRADRR